MEKEKFYKSSIGNLYIADIEDSRVKVILLGKKPQKKFFSIQKMKEMQLTEIEVDYLLSIQLIQAISNEVEKDEEITRKVIIANKNGIERLRAIKMKQNGATWTSTAKEFKIDVATLKYWIQLYKDGGLEALNTERKPRKEYEISIPELERLIDMTTDRYKPRLTRILRVEKGEKLKDVAASEGVSAQAVLKDRRAYLRGELPPVLNF